MAVFILEDALSVWTNLGKHLLLDALCVSSVKTGTRRIMRLDELSFVVRLERRTTEDSSSRRIMRLVPVFILETHNASNNKCLPKFVQTDNASSSIKTANRTEKLKKKKELSGKLTTYRDKELKYQVFRPLLNLFLSLLFFADASKYSLLQAARVFWFSGRPKAIFCGGGKGGGGEQKKYLDDFKMLYV